MAVTAGPQLDLEALTAWVGSSLGDPSEPLTATRIGATTGIANTLYELRRGSQAFVLRRPPAILNDKSAGNMLREWRILTALEGTPGPHPTPFLLCEDATVIGAPFLIMDKVDGFTPGYDLPEPFHSDPRLRRGLAEAYVDGLVELAAVDWRARGLEGLGQPEGFLERQVPRWLAQLDRYRTRHLPELDFVTDWLERSRPPMSAPGILHGDYSPFNLMVAPRPPARLAAIVDWDTGTIGDPLLDIGHLLGRWTDPGEEPVLTLQAGGVEHYPTRAELAARYAERSGRDLSALPYYECLALFKLAVILEGNVGRAVAAGAPEEDQGMAPLVVRLMTAAAGFARAKGSEMGELAGKVAVVTGGSRGIGRAIVDGLAAAGAGVVIASRKFDACAAAADDVNKMYGVRALPVAFHAAQWSDCDRLGDTVQREYGRCDVLVNNAGVSPRYQDLAASLDEAYYDKVAAVNLKGPFRLSVLLAQQMTAGAGGSIINVSTIGSLRPGADELVYACAKAGLNALTIGLAGAYGPSVRVNALLPGPVDTDIAVGWSAEMRARSTADMPLGRMGQAADYVGPALWLATSASAFVTGTLIRVDGGLYRQIP